MSDTKKVSIDKLKPNPDNPRIIKDDKFKKLVQSIKDFPEMLKLRPIVVDKDMVVLGGNMRLRALKDVNNFNTDDIDLDAFFEEDNTDKEQKFKIILEYTQDDYNAVQEALKSYSGSKEQIFYKLLGL